MSLANHGKRYLTQRNNQNSNCKPCNRRQAGKNMQPVPSGKTCNRRKAQENMQQAPSAGKHATDAKRGKRCDRRQARENMQPAPATAKHATSASAGKHHRAQSRVTLVVLLIDLKFGMVTLIGQGKMNQNSEVSSFRFRRIINKLLLVMTG